MNSIALSRPLAVVKTMRGNFLLLPPVCIALGLATGLQAGAPMDWLMLGLIMLGGVLAHVSVNMLNEYQDFTSGLDFNTRRTPFSGGTGALPAQPTAARWVLAGGIVTLLLVIAIGLFFMVRSGWSILPFGLLGAALIVLYTGPINRNPLLCLIAPGLGFGVLMVAGTHLLLAGSVDSRAWLASLLPFFLVNNLLLLNQFPDIDADRQAGRYHALIAWGVKRSAQIFAGFWLAAIAVVVGGIVAGLFPAAAWLTLIGLAPGAVAVRGAFVQGAALGEHPPYLAANVICTLLSPLILALTLLL